MSEITAPSCCGAPTCPEPALAGIGWGFPSFPPDEGVWEAGVRYRVQASVGSSHLHWHCPAGEDSHASDSDLDMAETYAETEPHALSATGSSSHTVDGVEMCASSAEYPDECWQAAPTINEISVCGFPDDTTFGGATTRTNTVESHVSTGSVTVDGTEIESGEETLTRTLSAPVPRWTLLFDYTSYLQIWFADEDGDEVGSYVYTGDPAPGVTGNVSIVLDGAVGAWWKSVAAISRWSCVPGYEPDISDPENPQANGFPDPEWEPAAP